MKFVYAANDLMLKKKLCKPLKLVFSFQIFNCSRDYFLHVVGFMLSIYLNICVRKGGLVHKAPTIVEQFCVYMG